MENRMIFVHIANLNDTIYAEQIVKEIEKSAITRGSGISKRSVESIVEKIKEGKAVISVTGTGEWVGFAYLEVWQNGLFVSNSGLIVSPKFRNMGVARAIKERIFKMSRRMYPDAKIFSITSGSAIMKMNTRLGFDPVGFAEVTKDELFWEGCKSCVNYNILDSKKRGNCLCTAMLFDPDRDNKVMKNNVAKSTMVLDCTAQPLKSLAAQAEGTSEICSALADIKWFTEYVFPVERDLPDPVDMVVTSVNKNIQELNCMGKCCFTVQIQYDHSYNMKEILNVIRNHTSCKFTVRDDIAGFFVAGDATLKNSVVLNNY